MQHAITVGDIFWPLLIVGCLVGIGAILMFAIWILNPFRSGH